jgi:hypothetical protein
LPRLVSGTFVAASIGALVVLYVTIARSPPPFDAAAEFSAKSNPAGTWSYGYKTSLRGPLHLFDLHEDARLLEIWRAPADNAPRVLFNPTAGSEVHYQMTIEPRTLVLQPGTDGSLATVRWTCPRDGWYRFDVHFRYVLKQGTGVGLQHVGAERPGRADDDRRRVVADGRLRDAPCGDEARRPRRFDGGCRPGASAATGSG